MQRIGEQTLLTSGSITYTIDKLGDKGSLKRVPCREDRRVTFSELTPAGKELFDRIFLEHAQAIARIMNGLTVEEQRTVAKLLKKVGRSVQVMQENA